MEHALSCPRGGASGAQLLVQLAGVSVDGLLILLSTDTGRGIHLLVSQ